MGASTFHVLVTDTALHDLHEIDDYWFHKGEPELGVQYVLNLLDTAQSELASPMRANGGRKVRAGVLPDTREILVFKGSYRIIYRVDASAGVVHVLRFWHSHRDEPDFGAYTTE